MVESIFAITLIITAVIAVVAYKRHWKIVDFF